MSSHSHAHLLFPRRAFIEHDFAERVFNLLKNYLVAQIHSTSITPKSWRMHIKRSSVHIETESQYRESFADLIDQLTGIKKLDARSDMDESRCWHLHGVKIVLAKSFASDIAYRALAREWLV